MKQEAQLDLKPSIFAQFFFRRDDHMQLLFAISLNSLCATILMKSVIGKVQIKSGDKLMK